MSRDEQRAEQRAERRIRASFALAALAGAGFAATYTTGDRPQLEGATLGLALLSLAFGLLTWAKSFLPSGGVVEQHEPFSSPPREQDRFLDTLEFLPRARLLRWLGLAVGVLGLAVLFPVRSLLRPQSAHPAEALKQTAWGPAGARVVDKEGEPVRAADVTAETIVTVYPEGHLRDGDAPAFLVRLQPARLAVRPPGGDVDGIVAYSLLCTHAGCPVGLYEQGAARVFCPCHQSAFDLLAGAKPIAGPAARPLPGLPLAVDGDGYLRATGDFTAPTGPGFWSWP